MADDEPSMNNLLRDTPAARRSEALAHRLFGTDPEPQQPPDTNAPEERAHNEEDPHGPIT